MEVYSNGSIYQSPLYVNYTVGNETDDVYTRPPPSTSALVINTIRKVGPPLLLIGGTIGNFLVCAVLMRKRFKQITTSVFLLALAISDTIYLYFSHFTMDWMSVVFSLSFRTYSDWSCRLIVFIWRMAAVVSSWLVVAVTIERLFAVLIPFKAKVICVRRKAYFIVGIIICLVFMINLFALFAYKVHAVYNNRRGPLCYVNEDYGSLVTLVVVMLDYAVYSFIPVCIIFLSNTAIIIRLAHARRTRSRRSEGCHGEAKRLTVMLITVSFVFLLTTLPICSMAAFYAIVMYNGDTVDGKINRDLSALILRVLMNSNHAFNFLLYCLSGPPFRQELWAMLSDCFREVARMCGAKPHTALSVQDQTDDLQERDTAVGMSVTLVGRITTSTV